MGLEVDTVPCHYCESPVTIDSFVIDHKIPSSELLTRTEKQEISNLVISCKSCNSQKGVLPYDMFYAWKQSTIKPQEPDKEKTSLAQDDSPVPSSESSQDKAS